MFLYGLTCTQKTLIFHFLSKVLQIYFASSISNGFIGVHNFYDLWLFDEFHEPEEVSFVFNATERRTEYANTLLKILDGQECRLDSQGFTKVGNVPIVFIAQKLPKSITRYGPLQERFIRLPFNTRLDNLKEERIIATFWGCVKRRLGRNLQLLDNQVLTEGFTIDYNQAVLMVKKTLIEDVNSELNVITLEDKEAITPNGEIAI